MNAFLAGVLLFQDYTAEESFKKIEKTLEEASSLRVKFNAATTGLGRVKVGSGAMAGMGLDIDQGIEGSLLVKGGKMINLSTDCMVGQTKGGYFAVSDGQQLKRDFARDVERRTMNVPSDFVPRVKIAFLRGGILLAYRMTQSPSVDGEKQRRDIRSIFGISEIRHGEDNQRGKALKYTLSVVDDEMHVAFKAECVLRYQSETWKPLARTVKFIAATETGEHPVLTETYSEFTLNPDVPDEKFKLPQGK